MTKPILYWCLLLAYVASPYLISHFVLDHNPMYWLPVQVGTFITGALLAILAGINVIACRSN